MVASTLAGPAFLHFTVTAAASNTLTLQGYSDLSSTSGFFPVTSPGIDFMGFAGLDYVSRSQVQPQRKTLTFFFSLI